MAASDRESAAPSRFERTCWLDLRTLGLWRIALGAILLVDVWDRTRHFSAHYLESGVLPVDALEALYGASIYLSAHVLASGTPALEAALFVLEAAAAVAILVGWHTRIATILCWYLVASVQIRNPYVSGMSGDMILRVQLMWGAFLPTDARFSVAALRRSGDGPPGQRVASVATLAMLLQVAVIYVAAGLHKFTPSWNDGTAVYWVMHLDDWNAQRLAPLLTAQPTLMWLLAHATRVVEILFPLFLFSPWYTGWGRLLAFAGLVGFHAGTLVFLDIGLFPWISIVIWLVVLPSELWDDWLPRLGIRRFADPASARLVPERLPRPAVWLAVGILAYVGVQQTANVLRMDLPDPVYRVGQSLRINQHWKMFAPPAKADFWLVVDGVRADGIHVDPFQGRSPQWTKPIVTETFPNFRWRLYVLLGLLPTNPIPERDRLYPPFGRWLCERWNAEHPGSKALEELVMWGVVENTLPPYQGEAPLERMELGRHRCGEGEAGRSDSDGPSG